jgi:hypothetical protein
MNNPPAFPVQSVYIEDQETNSRGMTLLDYMAAKAMQGMLSGLLAYGHDIVWDQVAEDAYRQAHAMLKAKEKEQ